MAVVRTEMGDSNASRATIRMKRDSSGNARYQGIACLKRLLTTGSVQRNLGSDRLLGISRVARHDSCLSADLQDLGTISTLESDVNITNDHILSTSLTSSISRCGTGLFPLTGTEEPLCKVCGWRFPFLYGPEDKLKHAALARLRECHKDIVAYRRVRGEIKRLHARLAREQPCFSEDLLLKVRYSSVKLCPYCGEKLTDYWGQFKKLHLDSCKKARLTLPKALS